MKTPPRSALILSKSTRIPQQIWKSTGKNIVLRGKIQGEPKKSSFTRADGSPSDYIAFDISDENNTNKVRAVIWNNAESGDEQIA